MMNEGNDLKNLICNLFVYSSNDICVCVCCQVNYAMPRPQRNVC